MKQDNFDIVIIGGSFAGMTSALGLANISPDIKIAIIEKIDIKNQDRKNDGRSYAISSSSLQFFQEIDIYDELQQDAGKIRDIKISDGNSPLILDFFGATINKKTKQLGQIIESYQIHNALRNKILKQKNITIFCPNYYKEINLENGAKITLDDNKIINAKLLLACDGRSSQLRHKFQIHTITKKYHQAAIVFDICHKNNHNNVAFEKFYPQGPLAILPLKEQNKSSIVWIVPESNIEAYLSLDNENFISQLNKKIADDVGIVSKISSKFTYPLTLVEANKFYHKKMLLVGDSACGIHPIAGQGFNLAISSIEILKNLIKDNFLNGFDISSSNLITEYNKKARFNSCKMVVATDILNSLFESKSLILSKSRRIGLAITNKIPYLKKIFITAAGGRFDKN